MIGQKIEEFSNPNSQNRAIALKIIRPKSVFIRSLTHFVAGLLQIFLWHDAPQIRRKVVD